MIATNIVSLSETCINASSSLREVIERINETNNIVGYDALLLRSELAQQYQRHITSITERSDCELSGKHLSSIVKQYRRKNVLNELRVTLSPIELIRL